MSNKTLRNIIIQKAPTRPNTYMYKLSLPSWVIEVLGINIQGYSEGKEINRQIRIYEENGKIIIEKVNKIKSYRRNLK